MLALAVVLVGGCAAPTRGTAWRHRPDRLERPGLERTLLGALAWLEDNQVRDRPGRGSSLRDASDAGDGCRATLDLALPLGVALEVPAPIPIRNHEGAWASRLHFLPHPGLLDGRALLSLTDTNCFVTALAQGPLEVFDDGLLPPEARFVARLRRTSREALAAFRRGDGWAFWSLLPGGEGRALRAGPLNAPVAAVRATVEACLSDPCAYAATLSALGISDADLGMPRRLFREIVRRQTLGRGSPRLWSWIRAAVREPGNPAGADALLDVPADADDTAEVLAIQALAWARGEGTPPDSRALAALSRHRDVDRVREDGRDTWKGCGSGAYLTWLVDEGALGFGHPEQGVVPLGVNNVDAVANANLVRALALCGRGDLPGFADAVRLVARCALERRWPEAGLYYPQHMSFPRAAARAWREGGVRDPLLDAAARRLLGDLLDLHEHAPHRGTRPGKGFPGGRDPTEALATALGLCALLDLGAETARAIGDEVRYERSVDAAATRLLALAHPRRQRGPTPPDGLPDPVSWEAGVVFAASVRGVAEWRSEAVTTALALEALAKYAIGWDRAEGGRGPATARLRLLRRHDGALRAIVAPR